MLRSRTVAGASAVLLATALSAQAPQAFNYQAIVRTSTGEPLADHAIAARFSLHQGTAAGSVVFEETHSSSTNAHGLFNLQVGTGTPISGSMAAVDWSNGPYFMEVGVDTSSSDSYTSLGTQQLLSVPYALHASSSNVPNGTMPGQTLHWDGGAWVADSAIVSTGRRIGIGVNIPPQAPLGIASRDSLYVEFKNGDIPDQDQFSFVSTSEGHPGFGLEQGSGASSVSRIFVAPSSGNVGIGNVEPHRRLHVSQSTSSGISGLQLQNTATTSNPGWSLGHLHDTDTRDGAFSLLEETTGGTSVERVVVTRSGNVGINESTPTTCLHVTRPATDPSEPVAFTAGTGIAVFGPITDNLVFDHQGVQARTGVYAGETLSLFASPLNLQPLGGPVIIHGDAASPPNERVLFTSDGKLGLGTLTPNERLEIDGAIKLGNAVSNSDGTIRYTGSDFEGRMAGQWRSLGTAWEKVDNTGLVFNPGNGQVGINAPLPDATLHTRTLGDTGNGRSVLIENSAISVSTTPGSRVGLEINCTGVWSAQPAGKDIGLYVKTVTGSPSAENNLAAVLNGNVVVGDVQGATAVGTGGTNVLAIQTGSPPSASGQGVQLFATVNSLGSPVLAVMNGNGEVIQLYRLSAITAADLSTVDGTYDGNEEAVINNMRERINNLEERLKAIGILAP